MNRLSLIQRLWLMLAVAMLAVVGALATDLLAARHYIEQQLSARNADTANGLALMITQYRAEPAMAETLINAAFDQGHYHSIRWLDERLPDMAGIIRTGLTALALLSMLTTAGSTFLTMSR